jgi:hypothetical protein
LDNYCSKTGNKCKGTKKAENDYCYIANKQVKTLNEFFNSFPNFIIRINNVDIEWTPDKYFIPDKRDPLKYCMGIDSQTYF